MIVIYPVLDVTLLSLLYCDNANEGFALFPFPPKCAGYCLKITHGSHVSSPYLFNVVFHHSTPVDFV